MVAPSHHLSRMKERLVVFTGAGISAESGLATFRDAAGLWEGQRPEDLASVQAWQTNPQRVLRFYNARRDQLRTVEPNAAHRALVELERKFEVDIVTQNVDDLHERAGSSRVLHLHGQLMRGRSECDPSVEIDLGTRNIALGDQAPDGAALRPAVVWFGEEVPAMDLAIGLVEQAERFLVIGTSLSVWPAAGLMHCARRARQVCVITPWAQADLSGVDWIRDKASSAVPTLVARWLAEHAPANHLG